MDINAQFRAAGKVLVRFRVIDWRTACEVQRGGHFCGGALHAAHYPRKALGYVPHAEQEEELRFSFCCDQEGCRRRVTPPSVRFLGRRVYWGLVVVLLSVAASGTSRRQAAAASQLLGMAVSESTLARWSKWWQEEFPISPLWQRWAGLLEPGVDRLNLPQVLLGRFGFPGKPEGLVALLEFLRPLTSTSCERI